MYWIDIICICVLVGACLCRNFKKAFNDVILSRRAIRNMNTLYPDATAEELLAADNVCIICREEMTTASKKLPCNHIFHTSCLRSWFQRQQTCPTCRLNVSVTVHTYIIALYSISLQQHAITFDKELVFLRIYKDISNITSAFFARKKVPELTSC